MFRGSHFVVHARLDRSLPKLCALLLCAIVGWLSSGTAVLAGTIYVDASNNSGTYDGSAQYPFASIQAGVNAAQAGDEIQVAAGTYAGQVNITGRKDLTIIGTGESTILQHTSYKLYIVTSTNIVVSGVNVRDNTHGVMVSYSDGVVIEDSTIQNIVQGQYNGGTTIIVTGSTNVVLRNNVIKNNYGGQTYGAAYVYISSVDFDDNKFINNLAWNNSGGIKVSNSGPAINFLVRFRGNLFYRNQADFSGAIDFYGRGTLQILNNVFVDSGADYQNGGAIDVYMSASSSTTEIRNNVIEYMPHSSPARKGVRIKSGSLGHVHALNNIFRDVNGHAISLESGSCTVNAEYNNAFGMTYSGVTPGAGSISSDPLFVDAANTNYYLQAQSPCIDAGHPGSQYNDPNGTRNDMGAFGGPSHLPPPPYTPPVADNQSVSTDQDTPLAITLTGSDADNDPLTFQVISGPSNGALSGTAPSLTYTPDNGYFGADEFTFTVSDTHDAKGTGVISIVVHALQPVPVIYVDVSNSSGTENGTAEHPFTSIQAGVNAAQPGDEIHVAAGTYIGAINISGRTNIVIVGSGESTIVEHTNYKLNIVNSTDISASGLNIRNGAFGVMVNSSQNVVLEGNYVQNISQGQYNQGTTIRVLSSSGVVIRDNIIRNNYGGQNYGAAYIYRSDVDFDDNQFLNNIAWNSAGGVYVLNNLTDKTVRFRGNHFNRNRADNSGAIQYHGRGQLHILNNTFTDSGPTWQNGGAIDIEMFTDQSTAEVRNNVIENMPNASTVRKAVRIRNNSRGFVHILNNIFQHSSGRAVSVETSLGSVTAEYNNAFGMVYFGVTAGAGSISANPLFVDAANTNYHLQVGSPCIDTGHPDSQYNDENGTRNDMGAFGGPWHNENLDPINTPPVAYNQSVVTGQDTPLAITLTGSDADGDPLTFHIVAGPLKGSLSGTAPSLTYTPVAGSFGLDSFTFLVNDGEVDSQSATITITVERDMSHPVLTLGQIETLYGYAEGTVRYFTSPWSNNKIIGFPHAYYGMGVKYPSGTMTAGDGSHVNINEVTLRFLSLAAAYKMEWLDYLPVESRYSESWGQILTGLQTLRDMQLSGEDLKYFDGSYHRTYLTVNHTYGCGEPQECVSHRTFSQLSRDAVNTQSSDDNGLPYMNLLILEGMAQDPAVYIPDATAIVALSEAIRQNINLARFYWPNETIDVPGVGNDERDVIVFNLVGVNGVPSLPGHGRDQGIWDRKAAEGTLIAAAMLLNGDISRTQFTNLVADSLFDNYVEWDSYGVPIDVEQGTFHSAMFIHGLRSLHGMPVTEEEASNVTYFVDSMKPVFDAHIDWAIENNLNALGSKAMTQALYGYPLFTYWNGNAEFTGTKNLVQYPGNDENVMPVAGQIYGPKLSTMAPSARSTAPHAFFMPLSRSTYLHTSDIDWIMTNAASYAVDFFNTGSDTNLGWEAVIPWTPGDTNNTVSWYGGGRRNYTDTGRPFEALNAAYTVLSIFDALNPDAPLASYSVEKERAAAIAAFIDSGIPLPTGMFP